MVDQIGHGRLKNRRRDIRYRGDKRSHPVLKLHISAQLWCAELKFFNVDTTTFRRRGRLTAFLGSNRPCSEQDQQSHKSVCAKSNSHLFQSATPKRWGSSLSSGMV